ncbi:hypothetical protein [Rathayibacter oskolensis]|nr:hypothetical protein [Rathayibacter oskolensis]
MTEAPAKAPRTFRIGNGQIVLGWKQYVALVGCVVIIVIGFATNTANPWAGALVALSTVIGTLVGVALQFQPVATDPSPRALAAIRGLGNISQSTADANQIVAQVLTASKEARTQTGLLSVQLDLAQIVTDIRMSMVQWEGVAPGSVASYEEDRVKSRELFQRLAEKENDV